MERSERSLVLLVIALLCSGHLVLGSHFRGTTISWKYIGGNKVLFDYTIGWRRDSSKGKNCDADLVAAQTMITSSSHSWECVEGCNSEAFLKYRCIGFNKPNNWMMGSGTFEMDVQAVGNNIVEYTDCCYIKSSVMTANNTFEIRYGMYWKVRTTIDIGIRQDIGKPNSSPVTISKALTKVKSGCPTSIALAVSDPDGDDVHCRLAVGDECGDMCGIVPYGSLDETTCILTFNPPRDVQGFSLLALTLEDFATVNGQMMGPFSSVPLQMLLEFQPNATCTSPKFVGSTPNNNAEFSITSGQSFSFNIDIQSSSSSESIDSLSPIVTEPTTQQIITRDASTPGLFHTSLTVTPPATSFGQKRICFFATESSEEETEMRCIILTIESCIPISFSYSPQDFNQQVITWSISFTEQLRVNSTSGFISFLETRSSRLITKVAASSTDIQGDLMTLSFSLPLRALPNGQQIHITVDDGIAESKSGLTCEGYDFTAEPFIIPRTAYAECHASGDPHFSSFQNFHFSSMGTGTRLLAAHCPNGGQQHTWEVFILMETEPNSLVSSTTRADILVHDKVVSFIHLKGTEVDGVLVELPYYDPSGDFYIVYEDYPVSVLHTKDYFTVKYNGWRRVQVELESEELYRGQMCGLCGSYDGTEDGNTRLPDGSVAPDLNTFFQGWSE